MIYDEQELQRAIEAGERRLAQSRQAARKRKRAETLALVVALVAACLGGLYYVASKRVPGAPHFLVTWPKSDAPQGVASGQTVLLREGQPFDVAISESSKWDVTWTSPNASQSGESVSWAPQKGGEQLLARCRAQNTGWMAFFSSVVPTRDLSLGCVAPSASDGPRRTVSLPEAGAWVCPHVQVIGDVGWDERALPALSASASVVPDAVLSQKLDSQPAKPALWQLVSNFDGDTRAPTSEAATYALLHAPDLETMLPQVAAKLVRLAPDASIKWILRLDKDAPEGIIRVAFDGRRSRQAWIKHKGASAGTPVTGWEVGAAGAPEVPTPTPTSRQ